MKKRIQAYMEYVDNILKDNKTNLSYEAILAEHEKQLAFFMHERLVHLLVTLTFALLAFAVFCLMYVETACFDQFSFGLIALFLALLVLLIPYIMHYFLLENSCHYMYKQYDALKQHISKDYFQLKD